jgi:general secretion pathway protein A
MSYYKILGLDTEPFSTSPDPAFFYESQEHQAALMRIMIEVRLKRGLSVILGDIGIGKTTLSRKLFQMLKERSDIIFHMMLDPSFETEELFLESLIRTFGIEFSSAKPSVLDYKEALKKYLFDKGVEENKTIVLLVDEAQKLNTISLEMLRTLLNYETNEYKLLQLVLLGQLELVPKLKQMKNLCDRISLKYVINPFDEKETYEMINFRLKAAGYDSGIELFTRDAITEIYRHTQGYPRRISMLCHNILKTLVMEKKFIADGALVRDIVSRDVRVGV